MLFLMAAFAQTSVDADVLVGLRPGVGVQATHRVWRSVTLGGTLQVARDPYGLVGYLGDFPRKRNVYVALLPGVGVEHTFGRRERMDVHGGLFVGPEVMSVDEEVSAGAVTATYRTTAVVPRAVVRCGLRGRLSETWGIGGVLQVPVRSPIAGATELKLGLGITARLGS